MPPPWRSAPSRYAEFAARVVERVREIPRGFVSTYGDIDRRAPRRVGYVLAITTEEIPWHRVVRASGEPALGARQLDLLREEGVPIRNGRVDLRRARYGSSTPPPGAGRAPSVVDRSGRARELRARSEAPRLARPNARARRPDVSHNSRRRGRSA